MLHRSGAAVPADCRLRCDGTRPFLTVRDNQGQGTTTLVQCIKCGVVREEPRPPASAIRAFYDDVKLWTDSTDAEGQARSYVEELDGKTPLFRDLLRRIKGYKKAGKVLDVGSGPGLLESVMREDGAGWEVTGVEMSPYIARVGREQLGNHVLDGKIEEIALEDRSFDVVVLKYVLDHLEDPARVIDRVRQLIRRDGLLVVADLINIDSFCARFFREGHRLIHPMHFTYFSPSTIRSHLARAGFRVVRIDRPYFRTPYFNARNVRTFVERVAKRSFNVLRCSNDVVFSPPAPGNMIDVFAVPV